MITWQEIFGNPPMGKSFSRDGATAISNLPDLSRFLDIAHVRHCLVRPYQTMKNYPVVETRELLPSFESDMYEYKDLPGFALVAFERQLDYFSEIFQFDKLHDVHEPLKMEACPLENQVIEQNLQIMARRLPKARQGQLREGFADKNPAMLDHYADILPFLLEMDRGQVMSLDSDNLFQLSGIFASFPSDIDSELKRFGIRIGKFVYGDSSMYERNRMFVYQFLMELYGFPIVSERRTSSALFARKLHRMGENFLLRVLGQTDRTLTTYISAGENRHYPRVEKIALVKIDDSQTEALDVIAKKGLFLDEKKKVVIMRVTYRQHRFDASNLRQDRALSVASQEIFNPATGQAFRGLNIIKDANNILLRLNDIVRGEYMGRIMFKRTEIVENTDTDEKRLKFLHSWLGKHQRRMIDQSDEFYDKVSLIITNYLKSPQKAEVFESLRELHQEVSSRVSYIYQARQVHVLKQLASRQYQGKCVNYRQMSGQTVKLLKDLKYEMVNFFPDVVDAIIACVEGILYDRYLQRTYIEVCEHELTESGMEIRKNYGYLVALLDDIKAVRKARLGSKAYAREVENA